MRYAGWNEKRGTVSAYAVSPDGIITNTEVAIGENGDPVDSCGLPLRDDGVTEQLIGWRYDQCHSFEGGRLLVPLMTPLDARKWLGLSVNEMAGLMGVHRQTWVKWERGERVPDNAAVRLMQLLCWLRKEHPDTFKQGREYLCSRCY